jgi:hypothetical protein
LELQSTHDGARFFREVASLYVPLPAWLSSGHSASCCAMALHSSLAPGSESGYHLRIKKVRKGRASVDFLDPRGAPVQRPYMGGAPTLKMVAHYDDYNGMFEVDLWEEGKGFILDLTHEYNYELDPERREALVPALSRNERDHFLDACYSLFGPLDHFVRRKAQNKRL